MNEHIDDVDLNVEKIADMMNLSRPTLYRKISAISQVTPNKFINIIRLKKAAELLQNSKMKVYEVSEAVGFSSQSYFSRAFLEQFGITPSQY
ncbi:MAG TPA: two-component system response regulator, partial [Erysipelotrichaceae bacterium]|nr:two-component system response regulator [Erysipelotrichaceae bacterium]